MNRPDCNITDNGIEIYSGSIPHKNPLLTASFLFLMIGGFSFALCMYNTFKLITTKKDIKSLYFIFTLLSLLFFILFSTFGIVLYHNANAHYQTINCKPKNS